MVWCEQVTDIADGGEEVCEGSRADLSQMGLQRGGGVSVFVCCEVVADYNGPGLSVLANLKNEIGELSRVTNWCRVFGMVNSAPDYDEQHLVINGFSNLILDVFGLQTARHARSAIGTHGLPLNFALEIEAELQISRH